MKNLESLFPDIFLPADAPLVIAGPCSAESREQTLSVAEALARGGVKIFRAGVWKPRTRPGGFEGAGEAALPWLQEVRERTGMRVITEVATADHLHAVLDAGLDAVWLGARTAANPFAVQEIADAFASLPEDERKRLAVLVKNPVSPDLELWIGALQRLYGAGVRRLGAIHRGFSYYSHGPGSYRNAPYWAIPFELRRRFPELPLFFDPSHTGGSREFIAPLSREALDLGFDGLIVEVHCNPDEALSDASQQLTPDEFFETVAKLRRGVEDPTKESLRILREEIDLLDARLLELLGQRMDVSRRIGKVKQASGLSVVQPSRYARLISERTGAGTVLGLSPEFVRRVFAAVHEESVRHQLPER
ncbi:MAG: bifunctional 3-deoxy-7-phosphoheptulonate synthase/chorismate mutase type II [Muribaculaceae bacterium]|nr:bifunctional 3-deoxy-7-phosphoheptulonate synthase/chorismate mutase type II [Muribaculaceae bacterium]